MKIKIKRKPNFSDKILAATFLRLFSKEITPNQITIFRFFTVPFLALLILMGEHKMSIVLFVVAAFSDALDGALARTTNRITEWGIAYDPLADKLLIGITALLVLPKYLGPMIVFIMILLEMTLIGLGYYIRKRRKKEIVMANWWGKSKMICQSVGVSLVLLYLLWPIAGILIAAQLILYLAIALAVISLITYSL